jgi:uncharacterized DUF497 family protein
MDIAFDPAKNVGVRLYCVVFVDRGDVRRIISLRKANRREEKRYAQA